ncbi:MAG: hypothetical protein MRJ93_03365 [Nitrososphaeraceae archaeon]|nr:hypothetical protein [Nitrososphaeraceae archaeon]
MIAKSNNEDDTVINTQTHGSYSSTENRQNITSDSNTEGPTMLWGMLKDKTVNTNDGEDLGKIKEISQNCFLTEKGTLNKHRLWIPKFLSDAYDGKILWLLVSEDEIKEKYYYQDEKPTQERFLKDFDLFKNSPTAKDFTENADRENKVRVIENYKNIRDLK